MKNIPGNPLLVADIYISAGRKMTDDNQAPHAVVEKGGSGTGRGVLRP
jgi:3'-phosphoadenosine 5'-phosphosulfate (PAPS) 3'-phosphatase